MIGTRADPSNARTQNQRETLKDDLVWRMYLCLAGELRQKQADPFEAPVTVAEIYQDLISYRKVRTKLRFEMNADYEHTLLRLLAGEGNHVRLEPREAREELITELRSANPNVGLFRNFAACDVWVVATDEEIELADEPDVTPAPVDDWGPSQPDPTPRASQPMAPVEYSPQIRPEELAADLRWTAAVRAETPPVESIAEEPSAEPDPAEPEMTVETEAIVTPTNEDTTAAADRAFDANVGPTVAMDAPEEPVTELLLEEEVEEASAVDGGIVEGTLSTSNPVGSAMPESPVAQPSSTDGQCVFCQARLPSGRKIKFCPFCGVDQTMVPCASCSEPLEQGWLYCIACGTGVT